MMRQVRVKICGLTTEADVVAVAAAGAAYAGFVFFAKSPRHLEVVAARALALAAPEGLCKVALTVDADDATLDAIVEGVPLDMLQLHGHETPARVAEVKARYGLPVMKAMGVAGPSFGVGMVFFALPTSTALYILSSQLNSDTELATAAIAVSTRLSVGSLSAALLM